MSQVSRVSKSRLQRRMNDDLTRFFQVMGYAKKYRWALAIGLLLVSVEIFFELYVANAQKIFIDNTNEKNADAITQFVQQSLLVIAAVIVLLAAQLMLKGLIQQFINRDMSVHLLGRINALPLKRLQSMHSADWVSRVARDVPESASISLALFDLSRDILLILFSFIYLSSYNIYLAAVALLSGPLIFMIGRLFDGKIRTLSEGIQKREADVRETLQEYFQGTAVIRSYGLSSLFEQEFHEKRRLQNKDLLKREMITTSMYQLMDFIINGIIIFVIYFVCLAVLRGELTVGTVLAFLYLLIRIQVPFSNISRTLSHVQQGLGASDRVQAVMCMEEEPSAKAMTDGLAKPSTGYEANREEAALRLEDISFCYRSGEGHETAVLHHIRFAIRLNETVAIVGMSGSGKSTLAKICSGLLEPDSGSIYAHGKQVTGRLDNLRSTIGYVPQSSFMFSGSIRDNITIGLPGITEEQLNNALTIAGAHFFIDKLPNGVETQLSEASSKLSGGEIQRLAIARAVLRETPILILDESTSAVDNEMERYLENSLRLLANDRALIIIAHRMSTVRHADRIIVMDQGKILATGTHEHLLRACELYAKLCRNDIGSQDDNLAVSQQV
ncbi:ATP-binding cassette subfamily B protein/subfamily B ATP-binding cassette protein MsbA [Paenibacillus phyllosphaerae]|uniref:ATP-binding cassette subfamily B protein/subfamily B ATP-binding cassette protein MsbA n=1 Tax=Paenibacillus phyllosphaerae TaxID=274593 RepID=A0A7W5ASR8_9BACL|nr:ABC transporter ATP-binding protein [Paenibacillus phyllosphaerae]MBB3107978.1 ATP-binding cassette subfamily B protein/subfamily B ATP-binding cassette protein MsbA [Paenibacillus phyllosphaerae]